MSPTLSEEVEAAVDEAASVDGSAVHDGRLAFARPADGASAQLGDDAAGDALAISVGGAARVAEGVQAQRLRAGGAGERNDCVMRGS